MAKDTSTLNRDHPIVAAACLIQDTFTDVAEQPAWSMSDDDTRATTLLLTRLEAQVAQLGRRVLCEADRREVAAETGGTSTANWLPTPPPSPGPRPTAGYDKQQPSTHSPPRSAHPKLLPWSRRR